MTLAPVTSRTRNVVPFVADLARHGGRVAVVTDQEELSYVELADRVRRMASRLRGPREVWPSDGGGAAESGLSRVGGGRRRVRTRRLVTIAGENSLDTLVTYLAALEGGHVPMLVPAGGAVAELVAHYQPDVLAHRQGEEWHVEHRTQTPAHDLHPDLALLLSTSGSTGSPKMVRLSHDNLQANAESIVEALRITSEDRAVTTLPLHYSYGLSVVHTHLLVGASLILTDLSVVAPCFWALCERTRPTTLAGVPHTFELLDRVGFAGRARQLGSLRQVTQAGGRMQPEVVRRWAGVGREAGFDLVVMYGQTEATARMAVLPPDLTSTCSDTVGRAIPGGTFRIDNPGACGAGELVYSGPNVMLGYAHGPADLALGRTVHELRTGDIARRHEAGLVQVVGRRSRFAKIVGLRIDLDRVAGLLAVRGLTGTAVDLGDRIGVLAEGVDEPRELARTLASDLSIPYAAVDLRATSDLPRLPSGKPDLGAVRELFEDSVTASPREAVGPTGSLGEAVTEAVPAGSAAPGGEGEPARCGPGDHLRRILTAYRELLDRPDATEEDSFVGLGGDSLSYVEVSIHLERILGDLPDAWHLMPVRELAETAARQPSRVPGWHRVETGIILRAVAILFVLVTHTGIAGLQGGAHILLALAGYNLARFHLGDESRRERLRGLGASLVRVVAPAVAWIGGVAGVTGLYDWQTVGLLNQVLGDRTRWSDQWSFWFIEAIAYILIGLGAALAVPAVDRLQRRVPWVFAMAVVGVGLLGRYAVLVPEPGRMRGGTAYVVLWLFALGWAAAVSRTWWQRVVVSAVLVVTVNGFWPAQPLREVIVMAGVLLLVWVPSLRAPRVVSRVAGVLASASLYIYLTHWQVYPALQGVNQWLAVAASIAVGLAYWQLVTSVSGALRRRRSQQRTLAG